MAIARSRGLDDYPTYIAQQLSYKLNFLSTNEYYEAIDQNPKGLAKLIRSNIKRRQNDL